MSEHDSDCRMSLTPEQQAADEARFPEDAPCICSCGLAALVADAAKWRSLGIAPGSDAIGKVGEVLADARRYRAIKLAVNAGLEIRIASDASTGDDLLLIAGGYDAACDALAARLDAQAEDV